MNIIIAVSGGIAAVKVPQLIRLLRACGHQLRVVMTSAAEAFVTPLSLSTLAQSPVMQDERWPTDDYCMRHIEWARWADRVLIAPCSANTLNKLAVGIADNALLSLALVCHDKLICLPAMNQAMWRHPATVAHAEQLRSWGVALWGPADGEQACGDIGPGRMLEPEEIVARMQASDAAQLADKRLLISAGGTQEAIDPIRYLGNRSTGLMGTALAEAANQRGAQVTLIHGPTVDVSSLSKGIACHQVSSAAQMADAVFAQVDHHDWFISAAAVADYTPERCAAHKIKKSDAALSIQLKRTVDILHTLGQRAQRPKLIGFCAETEQLMTAARAKFHAKQCDCLVANSVNEQMGFGEGACTVTLLSASGELQLSAANKSALAVILLDQLAKELADA